MCFFVHNMAVVRRKELIDQAGDVCAQVEGATAQAGVVCAQAEWILWQRSCPNLYTLLIICSWNGQ